MERGPVVSSKGKRDPFSALLGSCRAQDFSAVNLQEAAAQAVQLFTSCKRDYPELKVVQGPAGPCLRARGRGDEADLIIGAWEGRRAAYLSPGRQAGPLPRTHPAS